MILCDPYSTSFEVAGSIAVLSVFPDFCTCYRFIVSERD